MIRRGQRLRIALAAVAAVDQRDQSVDDRIEGVGLDHRVLIVRPPDGDGDHILLGDCAREGHAADCENIQAGGVPHA